MRWLSGSTNPPDESTTPETGPARGKSTGSTSSAPTLSPELYTSANAFQKRDNLLVLDLLNMAFRRAPSEDQQFLDIGCAAGDFTRDVLMARCSPCRRIVATDVSSSMIAYAKRFYTHPYITYDVLDLSHDVSPFVERYGRFDRVYSFFCLHWIHDQIGALRNIRKLMAPEGECLLYFCARTPSYTLWREFARMDRWKDVLSDVENFIPPSHDAKDLLSYLEHILAASELKPHTCEVLRNVWTFPTEQDIAGTISAVLPVAEGASVHEVQELAKAMTAEVVLRSRKSLGGFSAAFDAYVVHASRSAVSRTPQWLMMHSG